MTLDLVDYERKAGEAVKAFWGSREAAKLKQIQTGKVDQERELALPLARTWTGFWLWCSTSSRQTVSLTLRFSRTGPC